MMENSESPPWFIAAQRGAWGIGDRVRIKLSGEYPLMPLKGGGQIAAHQPAEDGQVGTITDRIEDSTACIYRVRFDTPVHPFGPAYETTIDEWLYTASELVEAE